MKNTLWRWAILAFGFLVSLIMLIAVTSCISANSYIPAVISPLPAGLNGMTTCDMENRPFIVISERIAGTSEQKYVLLHEHVHASQMRRVGCNEVLKHMASDPDFRFLMEAQAYCADLEARVADGANREQLLSQLVPALQAIYLPHESLQAVRNRLPCGRGNEPP